MEEKEEQERGPEGGSKKDEEEKTAEEHAEAAKAPHRPRTMQIKVNLLDDALYECELDVRAWFYSIRLHFICQND